LRRQEQEATERRLEADLAVEAELMEEENGDRGPFSANNWNRGVPLPR
jgi:hypothetical protein